SLAYEFWFGTRSRIASETEKRFGEIYLIFNLINFSSSLFCFLSPFFLTKKDQKVKPQLSFPPQSQPTPRGCGNPPRLSKVGLVVTVEDTEFGLCLMIRTLNQLQRSVLLLPGVSTPGLKDKPRPPSLA
ncbi:hypothetical protein, partial [Algoriphagus sp. AK58]|uniref:hypothetical protein n=1 Tax=Algoriphagus sp. AK58 TaxID=1406877 RepID=UPI001C9C721A